MADLNLVSPWGEGERGVVEFTRRTSMIVRDTQFCMENWKQKKKKTKKKKKKNFFL